MKSSSENRRHCRKLSQKAYEEMKREIDELSRKYASISRLERELHPGENLRDCSGLIIADFWQAPVWNVKPYSGLAHNSP